MTEIASPIESPISRFKREAYRFSGDQLTKPFQAYSSVLSIAAAKGVSPDVLSNIIFRSGSFSLATAINALVLRFNASPAEDYYFGQSVADGLNAGLTVNSVTDGYRGTPGENLSIDRAIREGRNGNEDRRQLRKIIGIGAQRIGEFDGLRVQGDIARTPIIIIGAGASGLLAAHALSQLRFRNIQIIDQRGQAGGIWEDERVFGASKNNPFEIHFPGFSPIGAAPGPGEHIRDFLRQVAFDLRADYRIVPQKGKITGIQPGDLNHQIEVRQDGESATLKAPIVILAPGNGTPLPSNYPGRIASNLQAVDMGKRWQEVLTLEKARELTDLTANNKPLILIGVGNSTAEMLVQIQRYNETYPDVNINFRVVTHYPLESIYSPGDQVFSFFDGNQYRLYRDLSQPNLTKMAGDLKDIDQALKYARATNSIIADVRSIDREGEYLVIKTHLEKVHRFKFDRKRMFSLIGYGHSADFLGSMGLAGSITNEHFGQINYDYDGEMQKAPGEKGRARLYPGYFALGPILKRPENPNAAVIPGDIFRLNDMIFSVLLRAEEYTQRIK